MTQHINNQSEIKIIKSFFNRKKLASIFTCISLLLIVLNFYRAPIALSFIEDKSMHIVGYNMLNDDTFYYLTIAKNIINESFSSFDGIVQTNGYHPLWMLIIVGLGLVVPIGTTKFLWLFMISIISITAFAAFHFHQLQKELSLDNTCSPVTIAYFFSALFVAQSGMEVCLIFLFLPIFLRVVYRTAHSSKDSMFFALGLTSSMLILSRLDTVIMVFLTGLVFLYYVYLTKTTNVSWKRILLFLVGLTPFIAYLCFNLYYFQSIVPISGQAKALHLDNFLFSQIGFNSILDKLSSNKYLLVFFVTTILSLPVAIVDVIRKRTLKNLILCLVMIYPFISLGFYLIRSDWPFWIWYYYPLSISFAFSLFVLETHLGRRIYSFEKFKEISILLCTLLLLVSLIFKYVKDTPNQYKLKPTINVAMKMQEFARNNPGIYAMGDRAGAVGFFLPQPLIQLEGLVSNKDMLKNISMQRNLKKVLKDNSVNYYITSSPKIMGNCWHVNEPAQSGPFAPKMKAVICDKPVLHYEGNGKAWVFKIENME